MLLLCVALPWLNPFASSPSTAVIPLLLSWMLASCALLLVVDQPVGKDSWLRGSHSALIVLLSWLFVSLFLVPEVVDHALTLGLLAALMCVWVMVAVGRRAAVDDSIFNWAASALLMAAVVSSILGVMQYLGLAHELAPWVNQPLKGDAFANLRQRNQFASLTSLGLVVLLGLLANRQKVAPLNRMTWFGVALVLNLLVIGVACSVSRTGALQWVLLSLLVACWAWRNRLYSVTRFALLAPLLIAIWSLILPWLAQEVTGEMGASMILRVTGHAQDYGECGTRSVLWRNVLTMAAQHPWLGWGWGETDYAHFMTAYPSQRFCDMLDNAHNFPLHLALEFGFPFASVTFAGIVLWIVRRKPWYEEHPRRVIAWGLLLVLATHSLLEYPLWYGPFQMTLGFAIGLLWARPQALIKQEAQLLPMLVASILFFGCLYAAWDFNRVGQIYRAPEQRDALYRANPLAYAKRSWLFQNQALFAEVTLSEVRQENAADIYMKAKRVMHYSPEVRVAERVIESAKILGYEEEVTSLKERLQVVKTSQR